MCGPVSISIPYKYFVTYNLGFDLCWILRSYFPPSLGEYRVLLSPRVDDSYVQGFVLKLRPKIVKDRHTETVLHIILEKTFLDLYSL